MGAHVVHTKMLTLHLKKKKKLTGCYRQGIKRSCAIQLCFESIENWV